MCHSASTSLWVCALYYIQPPLQWRHNEHNGVSNHQPHGCLLNRLFRGESKKTSKLRVTGLCAGIHRGPVNFPHKWPVTRKMFPFDDVIMAEIVSIRCRHHSHFYFTGTGAIVIRPGTRGVILKDVCKIGWQRITTKTNRVKHAHISLDVHYKSRNSL